MTTASYRSGTTAHGTGSSSLVVPVPAGVFNGDMLVLLLLNYNLMSVNPSPPTGWSTRTAGGALNNNHGISFYTRVASSEPASYTISYLSSNDAAGIMLCYKNVDSSTPYDTGVANSDVTSDTSVVQGSITTAHNNEVLVFGCVYANNGTFTPPAGFTQRQSVVTDGANRTYVACDMLQAAAGASGTITATIGTAARSESGVIALISPLTTAAFWTDKIKCAEVDN